MKNNNQKFNIICHFPEDKENIRKLSEKISEIHTEAVIRYMDRSEIQNSNKQRILEMIIESKQ